LDKVGDCIWNRQLIGDRRPGTMAKANADKQLVISQLIGVLIKKHRIIPNS
jgi:hypothetical protein